jgi:ketosteroid isomerase-like protein
MGARENLALIEELQQAMRDKDVDRYDALLADDAVVRAAGVPASMGGVTTGRQAIVDRFRRNLAIPETFEIKELFGDDEHVCVVGKLRAERWPGNEYLKAADQPYSTYECIVYRIEGDKVAGWTAYVNWLDAYVQVGLVDVTTLLS